MGPDGIAGVKALKAMALSGSTVPDHAPMQDAEDEDTAVLSPAAEAAAWRQAAIEGLQRAIRLLDNLFSRRCASNCLV